MTIIKPIAMTLVIFLNSKIAFKVLTYMFLTSAQSIVMTYIGDYAFTQGLGKQNAAHLLAIIGITNTVGRAVIGWFCDRPFVDCVTVNMVALLIAGCLNIAIPFIKSFELLATVCALYGFCMGKL